MASRRQERVEALLRRELAEMLVRDEVRDPRLQPSAGISITGVRVTADLSQARVFLDLLDPELDQQRVLAGFRSCSSTLRGKLGRKLQLRRVPELIFEYDESIGRGDRIEQILDEIGQTPAGSPDDVDGEQQ